jgi:hypothetical protein
MWRLTLLLLMVSLMWAPLSSAKNKPTNNSQDPYATAEYETAPAVNAAELAYRAILFDAFTVPPEWEAKARKLVTATEDQAIIRLKGTNAFRSGCGYFLYYVQVHDGKSDDLLFQREISTENNAFAAAWSFNDRNLPTFLGNVLADYLALRARNDKGVNVLPLEPAVLRPNSRDEVNIGRYC